MQGSNRMISSEPSSEKMEPTIGTAFKKLNIVMLENELAYEDKSILKAFFGVFGLSRIGCKDQSQ